MEGEGRGFGHAVGDHFSVKMMGQYVMLVCFEILPPLANTKTARSTGIRVKGFGNILQSC